MATVKQVQEYLAQLDSDTPLFAVILTRKDFNDDVIQGNTSNISSDDDYAKFVNGCVDGDYSGIGSLFVEWHGDDLYSNWIDFRDEELEEIN